MWGSESALAVGRCRVRTPSRSQSLRPDCHTTRSFMGADLCHRHQAVGALYVLQPEIHGCHALLKRGKPRGSIVGSPPLSRVPAIKLQQFPTTVGGGVGGGWNR